MKSMSRLLTLSFFAHWTDQTYRKACSVQKRPRDFAGGTKIWISSLWNRCLIASYHRLSTPSRLTQMLHCWLLRHRFDQSVENNSTWCCLILSLSSTESPTTRRQLCLEVLDHGRSHLLPPHHLQARSHQTNCFDNTDMFYSRTSLVKLSGKQGIVKFYLVTMVKSYSYLFMTFVQLLIFP